MATLFYPVVDQSYQRVIKAKKDSNELWYEKLNTKIVIEGTEMTGNELNITVYNNGSLALNSSKLDVIYGGTILPSPLQSFTVSKQGVWSPKSSINVTISNADINQRLKIITSNGIADYAIS
ncbi:MAG: hypothetical protein OIN89_04065 [Candidatus Methanoperedens sp.]|nr:hypothetical protein [Candidatus Methanoperedens sp.]